jgi:phage head maturation protease
LKERALDGLSIGYSVGEFSRGTKPNEPRRTIKTIKSLPEVSLVTFPMNELARTGAVKSRRHPHGAGIRGCAARRARLLACGRQVDRTARLQGRGRRLGLTVSSHRCDRQI